MFLSLFNPYVPFCITRNFFFARFLPLIYLSPQQFPIVLLSFHSPFFPFVSRLITVFNLLLLPFPFTCSNSLFAVDYSSSSSEVSRGSRDRKGDSRGRKNIRVVRFAIRRSSLLDF